MNNMISVKSDNKIQTPKTPGGISKSLLTPCRRIGLSRKWRKSGPSPFVSPVSDGAEVKIENSNEVPNKKDTRKRKERCDEEVSKPELVLTPITNDRITEVNTGSVKTEVGFDSTPSRSVSNPKRKKSKSLLSKIETKITNNDESPKTEVCSKKANLDEKSFDSNVSVDTPVRSKSKGESKIKLTIKIGGTKESGLKENINNNVIGKDIEKPDDSKLTETSKQKSPQNLTKECIVVMQKKINRKELEKLRQKVVRDEKGVKKLNINPVSQALFDSDTDDVPLSMMNKQDLKCKPIEVIDEDDDFESTKLKVKKLEDKTTSTSGLKSDSSKKKTKQKDVLPRKSEIKHVEHISTPLQSSLEDDDDFVMDNKKTILIRKTYEKVSKPLKAKSTGSITQKDIDDLKAKIEMKKKLLLAKAVTEDTQELRGLIKKWQKGCQDALMELMELMKTKFPDRQNLDYSEMLQTLKIPASLVGYDEENDCFGTPTDESIILSKFNDI